MFDRKRVSFVVALLAPLVVALVLSLTLFNSCLAKSETQVEEPLLMDKATYDIWQEGVKLMNDHDYEGAAKIFRKTIELLPGKPSPHCNLMNCLIKTGDVNDALNEAIEAAKLAPDSSLYMFNLGNAYQIAGRLDDAISTYTECVHKFPKDEKTSRTKAVIKELKKAAAQKQDSPTKVGLIKGAYSKWRRSKMPLRVFVDSGESIKNFSDSFKSTLIESFQDWAAASEGRVSFVFVNEKEGANIVVVWESERTKITAAEDGNTRLDYDNNGMNTFSKIILLTTAITGEAMNHIQIREVSLHEVGHSLGITQHSRNPDDIMFYSMHGKETLPALSEHDKETIRQLYDCPDASVAPPVPATPAQPIQFHFQH